MCAPDCTGAGAEVKEEEVDAGRRSQTQPPHCSRHFFSFFWNSDAMASQCLICCGVF